MIKEIYRGYDDTEPYELMTNIKCPYCGAEWAEIDMNDCGVTYEIQCEKCHKYFQMHFDI